MTDVSGQQSRPRPRDRRIAQWARDYAQLPGIPDEFLGLDGAPRAVWQRFFDAFAALSPADIQRRFDAADRHLHEAGVTYRAPGDAAVRDWPLSHVPLLIDESEWAEISAGVTQRAELLERLLRDIYGDGQLIADGGLPAAAIVGSPDYLHALRGIEPPGGQYLRFYAVDLGRAPDGRWWVLGDRTQAPSGAGYALENRLVLSRAMPSLFKSMNVERFAPFFEAFREALRGSAERDEPRIGLLTPGDFSETYFEHATLARYLGFLLVEGDDLAVSGDRVHIRTVAGLKRLDVLLRRVDSNSLDPLELDASSTLGVPGLIDVLRKNGVVIANMPGVGVLESRALLGFLPSLARRLLGEDLKLPHIATWWCGQKSARAEVLARFDDVAIESAFAGIAGSQPMLPSEMTPDAKARLRQAIETRGVDYVGQEVVRLSTTPVWDKGQLTPRPFVLRVFAAATKDGWTVMPGGFCRIAGAADARAVSMGEGARAADVWVVSDKAVDSASLLPSHDTVRIQRIAGWVPSRAADNLFWLGRYLERAEATLRLIRALTTPSRDAGRASAASNPSSERIVRFLLNWNSTSLTARSSVPDIARNALQGENKFGSALSLVKAALRAAGSLRERLSPDAWHVVTEIVEKLGIPADDDEAVVAAAELAIRQLASFSGLAQENMNRAAGWRFLQMGRRVERAMNTTRFARHFAHDDADGDDLDTLLTLGDCQISYRSRYLVAPLLAPVRDLIVLDPYNPRSTAFQVGSLHDHIGHLPVLKESGLLERPKRLAINLQAMLSTADASTLDAGMLFEIERDLMSLADAIGARYFPHGASAMRPEKAVGAGVIYDIRHVTTYNYASPVSFARCALRLEPIDGAGQTLVSHRVEIKPKPTTRTMRTDFFGINTESILIDAPHRALRIDSRARVEVDRPVLARDADSPGWEDIRELAFAASRTDARSPVNYIFASPLAPLRPAVTAYAQQSFPAGRGILAGAVELMRRIYTDFKYQSGATTISTPLDKVFAQRRGVCQDFAHIMSAGLRGLGLPAAYVSGYLRTAPPPGEKRLEGADATHAWAGVWCGPSFGWIGFDPTNDLLVANDHIVLAIGRDFSDVSPVDGVIVGSRRQRLGVAVDVVPVLA